MKNNILFLIFFLSTIISNAQSYVGYLYDNYSGVHSVINNPSNIVDSRYRADINLFSFSGLATNDYYGVKIGDILKSDYDFETDAKKYPTNSNNFLINVDVLGPSFMVNLSKKSSLALFTRVRSITHMTNFSGIVVNNIEEDIEENFQVNNQNFSIATNAWGEFGLSYARILMDKSQHFLKGGFSIKYLYGAFTGYAKAKNIDIDYNYTGDQDTSTITSSGILESGNITSFEDIDDPLENTGTGFGADFGFTYEYRPKYKEYQYTNREGGKSYHKDENKYKFKFGVSVTDIGSINYKDVIVNVYDVNGTYTNSEYDDNSSFDNLYSKIEESKSVKFKLPTAVHLNSDWNINNRFYINLNTDFSVVKAEDKNSSYINNNVSLTPRYEVKWVGLYVPLSYLEYSGFNAGFGFRVGPLFIGSSSAISALVSETKSFDAYLGLKIPIYQSKINDVDFDGIKDIKDDCPELAGPIENNGCPWGDLDGDGLTDNLDKCPNEYGSLENNGCPWADLDGDTVLDKDDYCPNIAGAVENNGCPWGDQDQDGVTDNLDKCPTIFGSKENEGCPFIDKDGDKILDKDDRCPDVFGVVENFGCPVIDGSVLLKLNDYPKSVVFDTGNSVVKEESYATLDLIAEIMKEYKTTNFGIEGHTDNVGNSQSNQKLSSDRALAIKMYLISKGIDESRLKSEGFGSAKPIMSNKTKEGKSANRRVEIKIRE